MALKQQKKIQTRYFGFFFGISTTIRFGREIQCLLYAVFFLHSLTSVLFWSCKARAVLETPFLSIIYLINYLFPDVRFKNHLFHACFRIKSLKAKEFAEF